MRVAGIIPLGHRMTVVRLPTGGLFVHSPVAWTPGLAAELARLGPVEVLVAPSWFHDSYWPPWFRAHPKARFLCAPGMEQAIRGITFEETLAAEPDPAWGDVLQQTCVEGMPKVNEHLFLHLPSRSLIVADFVFHLVAADLPPITGQLMRLFGSYDRFAVSKVYRSQVRDRSALRDSVERVLAWEPARVVVGHGRILEVDVVDRLHQAWSWLD
jgi:hypothetical protein